MPKAIVGEIPALPLYPIPEEYIGFLISPEDTVITEEQTRQLIAGPGLVTNRAPLAGINDFRRPDGTFDINNLPIGFEHFVSDTDEITERDLRGAGPHGRPCMQRFAIVHAALFEVVSADSLIAFRGDREHAKNKLVRSQPNGYLLSNQRAQAVFPRIYQLLAPLVDISDRGVVRPNGVVNPSYLIS